MVKLISKEGKEVEKKVTDAERILDWCRKKGKELWKLNDGNYTYEKGNLRRKKKPDKKKG